MQVELLNCYGSDDSIASAARVSFGKDASNYTEEQNAKLLNYLVKHSHTSPYRHSFLQFRITCPIFVERQIRKHEVGIEISPMEFSFAQNSISGRYVDFSDTYYEIEKFRFQSKSSKQGSAEDLEEEANRKAQKIFSETIAACKEGYDKLLELGVAKEQARCLLPLTLETQFIWTGSFQAFMHLCNLRLKPDTQQETRELVQMMLNEVIAIGDNPFKNSLKAHGYDYIPM